MRVVLMSLCPSCSWRAPSLPLQFKMLMSAVVDTRCLRCQILAEKFPSMGGMPCSFHQELVIGEQLGHSVPMQFQVPISGGRRVRTDGMGAYSSLVLNSRRSQGGKTVSFKRWNTYSLKVGGKPLLSWTWRLPLGD